MALFKYTDRELIKILKDKAKELGRTPKRREVYQNQVIKDRFGSWNEALLKANLKILKKKYTRNELIEYAEEFYKKFNRSPTGKDFQNDIYLPDTKIILKRFGSWNDYLTAAGLKINIIINKTKKSKKKLLEEFRREYLRIKPTSHYDYNRRRNKRCLSVTGLETKFNCRWNDILKLAKLPIIKNHYTDEEILSSIRELSKILKRTPSKSEYEKYYNVLGRNISERFNGWNNALIAAGLEPRYLTPVKVKETDLQLLKMYKKFSKQIGENIYGASSLQLRLSKQIYDSNVFVTRFGSMNELRVKAGYLPLQKGHKKYTKEGLVKALKDVYKKNNGRITNKELAKTMSLSTLLRYFNTTKISDVWNEVEKRKKR